MLDEPDDRGGAGAYCDSVAERHLLTIHFSYNASDIANIEASLSNERFATYTNACGGDRRKAITLYEWNSAVSAAFYVPLQTVEVALRNACHRELVALFGAAWPEEQTFLRLDVISTQTIAEATARLQRSSPAVATSRIVSELSFGFWTRLLGRRFEQTLWIPGLYRAFRHYRQQTGMRRSRPPIAKRFDYLRDFRNRIAHHEPVFTRSLETDYALLLDTAAWMYPGIAEWTDAFGACKELIRNGPP